jgi:hypothetical protein
VGAILSFRVDTRFPAAVPSRWRGIFIAAGTYRRQLVPRQLPASLHAELEELDQPLAAAVVDLEPQHWMVEPQYWPKIDPLQVRCLSHDGPAVCPEVDKLGQQFARGLSWAGPEPPAPPVARGELSLGGSAKVAVE